MNKERVVIAERVLRRADGGPNVTVNLFFPEKDEAGGFRCYYQIRGIGNESVRFGAGIDAIQSIQIAFQMIGADLFLRHKGVKLIFGDVDDPGFPPPLVVG